MACHALFKKNWEVTDEDTLCLLLWQVATGSRGKEGGSGNIIKKAPINKGKGKNKTTPGDLALREMALACSRALLHSPTLGLP